MKKNEAVFLLPSLLTLIFLIILPMIYIVYTSFFNKDTFDFENKKTIFVGLKNYSLLLMDPRFWNSMKVTMIVAFATVFFQMIFGLAMALLLWHSSSQFDFVRGLILFPMVVPPVIVGLLWKMYLHPILPGMNYFISLMGFEKIDWMGTPLYANAAIVMAVTWQWIPYVFLMLIAGLQSLPESCFESAKIDGASTTKIFFRITMPLLKRIFIFVLIYRFVETLKIFPIIYSLTGGGPGYATEPISYYIWQEAFNAYRMGYASSAVVLTMIIIIIVVSLFITYGKRSGVFK